MTLTPSILEIFFYLKFIERIHAHIDSFPAMESHYARKDSNQKFLSSSLNIRKMYDLYVKECQQKGK
jgi:hypothetical protein